MALAVDASSPAKATAVSGTTVTTASFTAPAASFLVAFVAYNTAASTALDHTVTDSGALTWTLKGRKSANAGSTGGAGTSGGVEVWTAPQATSAARTVTATSASTTAHVVVVKVFTDTAAPTGGAIAASSSASGLPSASLTTTATNSWVWSCSSDWADKGLGTAGTSQTISTGDEHDFTGGVLATHVWRQTATTAGSSTSVTNDLTLPTAQQYNELIFEVLAVAVAAVPPPVIISQAINRASRW